MTNRKKWTAAMTLAALLCWGGSQQASARGWGEGPEFGSDRECGCGGMGYGPQYQMSDEETKKKIDTFLKETRDTRKQLAMKRAEKFALLRADKPDAAAVAKLEGELFDLRSTLQDKAKAAGLPLPPDEHGGPDGSRDGRGPGRHMGPPSEQR